mmetsp:Transcript_113577/g.242444  ORF Transcript_113577/g.242444 Transcript_113577/m.242444 type:complete len:312 (+) Transcript_113577:492-1427(+)
MALHLRAKDSSRLRARDHVAHLGVVIGDEDLLAEARDVLAEPVRIVLAEGPRPDHLDAHLLDEHLRHGSGMRGVAIDDSTLAGEVLAIDRPREPCRLRHKARLLVDVLVKIERVPLRLQHCLDAPDETGSLRDTHGADVHEWRAKGLLQVRSGHQPDLAVRHHIEPSLWELLQFVNAAALGNDEVGFDAHVFEHPLELAAVVRVVEAQGECADDVGRRPLGLLDRSTRRLQLFHVVGHHLGKCPVGCLVLIHTVVVHIRKEHVRSGALGCTLAEVGEILLEDAAGARRCQHDEVGLILLVLPRDVVNDLLL